MPPYGGRQCRAGRIEAKGGRALQPCGSVANRPFCGPTRLLAEPRGRSHGESQAVKKMALLGCLTAALAVGAWGMLAGQSLAAQAGGTSVPSQLDLAHNTPSGNYLAARTANVDRDAATAAAYYT